MRSGGYHKCEKCWGVGCIVKEELKDLLMDETWSADAVRHQGGSPCFCLEQQGRWWCHLMKWGRPGEECGGVKKNSFRKLKFEMNNRHVWRRQFDTWAWSCGERSELSVCIRSLHLGRNRGQKKRTKDKAQRSSMKFKVSWLALQLQL